MEPVAQPATSQERIVGFCLAERLTMSEEREVKLLSLVDVLEPLSEEELAEVFTRCSSFSLDVGQEFYGSREYGGGHG
jgi:hypothetical protein